MLVINTCHLAAWPVYLFAQFIIVLWCVMWFLHVIALINAKRKLHRNKYTHRAYKPANHPHLSSNIVVDQSFEGKDLKCNLHASDSQDRLVSVIDTSKLRDNLDESTLAQNRPANGLVENAFFEPHLAILQKQLQQTNDKYAPISGDSSAMVVGKSVHTVPIIANVTMERKLANDNRQCPNWCIDFLYPGVSIIKPLVGVDLNLADNLETFFNMDYPAYELLFCVQCITDPAIDIVCKLMHKYPLIDSKLFISTNNGCLITYDNQSRRQLVKSISFENLGVNPKINNMLPAYKASMYELILVSDSGIRMKIDTLTDMVYHMKEDIALVHQMPFVCHRDGMAALIEKVYFGTAHARAYLSADMLGINCPSGMSALMRKFLIDEVGGLTAFGKYLAEDYFFAKSFTDRKWKISISSQPAWQNTAPPTTMHNTNNNTNHDDNNKTNTNTNNDNNHDNDNNNISSSSNNNNNTNINMNTNDITSASNQQRRINNWSGTVQFYQRISRWIKLRFAMVPVITLIEPMTECLMLGLLAAWSINFIFGPRAIDPIVFYVCHILIWLLFDYTLLIVVQNETVRFSKLDFLFAWLIRECTALFVFIDAIRDQNIRWRARKFRLKWGGQAYEIPAKS